MNGSRTHIYIYCPRASPAQGDSKEEQTRTGGRRHEAAPIYAFFMLTASFRRLFMTHDGAPSNN